MRKLAIIFLGGLAILIGLAICLSYLARLLFWIGIFLKAMLLPAFLVVVVLLLLALALKKK